MAENTFKARLDRFRSSESSYSQSAEGRLLLLIAELLAEHLENNKGETYGDKNQ
jgi:hypothetical protein